MVVVLSALRAGRPGYFEPFQRPQVSLVQQGCGLERMPRRLVRRLLGRQTTELSIDQGEKLLGRLTVAFPDRRENLCHLVHIRDTKGLREVAEFVGRSSTLAYRPAASEDKSVDASGKAAFRFG